MFLKPDVFVLADAPSQSRPGVNPFAGTTRITRLRRGATTAFEVFAVNPQSLRTFHDIENHVAIYLWGRAVHPSVAQQSLAQWCGRAVRENPIRLRELYGHFVILLDDRRADELSFVSDVLGARPWFVGRFDGRLVAGSDALSICDAGLSRGEIDYDAVSCWLRYNQELTGGSVVRDYRNVAPGAITTYNRAGEVVRQTSYADFEINNIVVDEQRLVDDLHERVSAAFSALSRDAQSINLPLSGGFDSRYLAALSAGQNQIPFELTTIQTAAYETIPARRVAEALRRPLRVIPIDRHILDLFDDPMVFGPAGFPTGRNLTSALARRQPGVPLLSGWLGDGLMRASLSEAGNKYFELEQQNAPLDALVNAADKRYRLKINRLDLLEEPVAKKINLRAIGVLRCVLETAQTLGKPQSYTDLYHRQRLYFANIFLQHLDAAEALTPYMSWELINYRMSHARQCYKSDTYQTLFRRHFPSIADIPHSSALEPSQNQAGMRRRLNRPTRHLRRWSTDLLRAMGGGMLSGTAELAATCKLRILSLLPSGLLAQSSYQTEIIFLRKLYAFEQRLRQAGLRFDWNAI